MTDKASPNETPEGADLTRFLQDWSALWREELSAQARDPDRMPAGLTGGLPGLDVAAGMAAWRSMMVVWAEALGVPASSMAVPGDGGLATRDLRTRVPPTASPRIAGPLGAGRGRCCYT